MEEDIELIILVTSKRVFKEKLLRKVSESIVRTGKVELAFLKKIILLVMAS